MRIYSGLLSVKQFQPEKQGASFLSVVVPCRNEDANLPFLLSDIARQTLDNNLFELIIVDDNSCDSTFRKASDSYNQGNIKVIRNRGIGKKTAIRTGVEESAGELIITIDADCRINGTFLETISSFYAESAPALIICPVALESGRSFFQRFQELEFLSLQGVTAGSALRGDPVMCNGAGLGFTKEAYLSHSDFLHYELASGDDVFLLHSLKKESPKSIRWIESDDAAVTTRLSGSVASFLRQRARWISKTGYYSDTSAKILAIVTFVTILSQLAILVAGIFSQVILLVFVAFVALKSVPDFIILHNTAKRYKKMYLLLWFLPSQLIYPFYVSAVVVFAFFTKRSAGF